MKVVKHIPYDLDEVGDDCSYHEHYWKKQSLELLINYISDPTDFSLLDYGCGRGEFLSMASEIGFFASGVDADPICVAMSKKYGTADLIEPDNYMEELGDDSIDIVTSFHVLEHVENPKRLLYNMARVAKKYVLIAVPNMNAFRAWGHRNDYSVNKGHLQGWDRETLNNLATQHCGLKLVAFSNDMTVIPSLGYRIRKLVGSGIEKKINIELFSRMFPYRSISIIALFESISDAHCS